MVSILIRTYSRGENLPKIIDSIIAQSYTDWRVLVSDNGNGQAADIMQQIIEQNPTLPILYDRNAVSIEPFVNFNRNVVKLYPTEYAVFLEDDTYYLDNDFLARAVKILDEQSDVTFVAGHWVSDGSEHPMWDGDMVVPGTDLWERWPGAWVYYGACVFRYDIITAIGGMSINTTMSDSLMVMYAAMMGKIALINTTCLESGYNKNGSDGDEFFADNVNVFRKEEEYFRRAAEFAVSRGVSQERADNWYINLMAHKVLGMLFTLSAKDADRFVTFLDRIDRRVLLAAFHRFIMTRPT